MVIKVKLKNNINDMLDKHKEEYGSSRTFIAEKMGISRQSLNSLAKSMNPTYLLLVKLAYILKCDVKNLIKTEIDESEK